MSVVQRRIADTESARSSSLTIANRSTHGWRTPSARPVEILLSAPLIALKEAVLGCGKLLLGPGTTNVGAVFAQAGAAIALVAAIVQCRVARGDCAEPGRLWKLGRSALLPGNLIVVFRRAGRQARCPTAGIVCPSRPCWQCWPWRARADRRRRREHRPFHHRNRHGVGKTYVTAALLAELRRRGVRAAAFKPIACGAGGRHDAEIYAAIMEHEQPLDVINPVYLRHPLAPSVAARLEHRRIDLRRIRECYRQLASTYSVVLVEGAGGLLVPIRDDYFVADLAESLKLPLLVVARLGLGTINHSLLTVRQARADGIEGARDCV